MMVKPTTAELLQKINDTKFKLVIATAKRARQIIAGAEPLVDDAAGKKALSIAVEELYTGQVKILGENEDFEVAEDVIEDVEEATEEM